jgi:hypothetical protein
VRLLVVDLLMIAGGFASCCWPMRSWLRVLGSAAGGLQARRRSTLAHDAVHGNPCVPQRSTRWIATFCYRAHLPQLPDPPSTTACSWATTRTSTGRSTTPGAPLEPAGARGRAAPACAPRSAFLRAPICQFSFLRLTARGRAPVARRVLPAGADAGAGTSPRQRLAAGRGGGLDRGAAALGVASAQGAAARWRLEVLLVFGFARVFLFQTLQG